MSRNRHAQSHHGLRSNNNMIDDITIVSDDEEEDGISSKNRVSDDSDDNEISFVDIMSNSNSNLDIQRTPGSPNNVRRRALKRRTQNNQQLDKNNSNKKLKTQHNNNNKENLHLREMLLSQMDLIQQQSVDIVKKEKKVRELQKENEKLRTKLKEVATKPLDSFLPAKTKATETSENITINNTNITDKNLNIKEVKKIDKAVVTDIHGLVLKLKICGKESKESNKNNNKNHHKFVESDELYFVQLGEEFLRKEKEELGNILRHSETPQWRVVKEPPSTSHHHHNSNNTQKEDIENESMLKRHSKLEAEEKRRKRWDMQRMREQKTLERLRLRYEKAHQIKNHQQSSSPDTLEDELSSILQEDGLVENLTHIEVTDKIPVSSFGFNLPDFGGETDFHLPWLNFNKNLPLLTKSKKNKKRH